MKRKLKNSIINMLYTRNYLRDIVFCLLTIKAWNKTWRFHKLPIIQKHRNAKITIGNDFIACSDPRKNSVGVFQKVIIKALSPKSKIKIGNNVGISGSTITGVEITIGNNVLIGSGCIIADTDAHPINAKDRDNKNKILQAPIIIEDDVFIGARSIILKGVTIGKGSVIGAGSVVSKSIPANSIAAGNPAKVIKEIE